MESACKWCHDLNALKLVLPWGCRVINHLEHKNAIAGLRNQVQQAPSAYLEPVSNKHQPVTFRPRHNIGWGKPRLSWFQGKGCQAASKSPVSACSATRLLDPSAGHLANLVVQAAGVAYVCFMGSIPLEEDKQAMIAYDQGSSGAGL